jgi:hypothetical protein
VFLIRKMSVVGSHLSTSSISHRSPPVRVWLHLAPHTAPLPTWPPRSHARSDKWRCPSIAQSERLYSSASASASSRHSHPAGSRHPLSCVTPLPVTGIEHYHRYFPVNEVLVKPSSCELTLLACFLRRQTLPCLTLSVPSVQDHRCWAPRIVEA